MATDDLPAGQNPSTHRRRVLELGVAASGFAIAGCISSGSEDEDTQNSDSDTGETPSNSDSSDTEFSDVECPPFDSEASATVCSHTVDTDAASIYLDASPAETALPNDEPSEEITLTLNNTSDGSTRFNPHSWHIWHNSESGWMELEQTIVGDGVMTLEAGDSMSWSFMEVLTGIQHDPDLEPGRYAAEIHLPDPVTGEDTGCIALLDLQAE